MALNTVTITSTWTRVGQGAALFTFNSVGSGKLLTNQTATDTNANSFRTLKADDQIQETATRDTYMRSDSKGFVVHVDGVI